MNEEMNESHAIHLFRQKNYILLKIIFEQKLEKVIVRIASAHNPSNIPHRP